MTIFLIGVMWNSLFDYQKTYGVCLKNSLTAKSAKKAQRT